MDSLAELIKRQIPNAELALTRLPQVPEIELFLLQDDYPQDRLTADEAELLMDSPPYWCFCWASGQVLARYLLDHADLVRDRNVVDFGAGSGVVAIAASLAGAKRVIACDNDLSALHSVSVNARHNQCVIDCFDDFEGLMSEFAPGEKAEASVICVADVFYDRDNLPLLSQFTRQFTEVLVADSRVKGTALPGLYSLEAYDSCNVPDLNESEDFNRVVLYSKSGLA